MHTPGLLLSKCGLLYYLNGVSLTLLYEVLFCDAAEELLYLHITDTHTVYLLKLSTRSDDYQKDVWRSR